MTMPAGTYYIGDLCYVLHSSWEEVCDLVITLNECLEGEFTLKDGRRFAIFNTMYGDGEYNDGRGHTFCVDSGSIGCILLSDVDAEDSDTALEYAKDGLAAIIKLDHSFYPQRSEGIIQLGHICIDTSESSEYDEEDKGTW